MADARAVLADLAAESDALDALVAGLTEDEWRQSTPAEGWTIAHQIAHLAWTDDCSLAAATDPAAFTAIAEHAMTAPTTFVDDGAAERAARPSAEILGSWRSGRAALQDALAGTPSDVRLPWFGPPMSATSMASARLMETWAHGQDVADTLGAERPATERLRNVAHIGVRTRDFAFGVRGLTPPAEAFRIELTGPSGDLWAWGPDGAAQSVAGPALDFCLLVTQRRHRDDLALVAVGPDADAWLDIAQAFAGMPGPGRPKVSL